jgi:hypothetical protein
MAGAGIPPGVLAGIAFPYQVGYGVLDRATGAVRYFADGLDESVAELNAGPDGAYYNGNSPIRRAFTRAIVPGLSPSPVEGGIRKYAPRRNDLLLRDAVCAAGDRAANAATVAGTCPSSAAADQTQIADLIAQARRTAPKALAEAGISDARWGRVDALLGDAEGGSLAAAAVALGQACGLVSPCPTTPRAGCETAARSRIRLKRRAAEPNADLLRWSWGMGESTSPTEFDDPTANADYGVCLYAGAPGSEALAYDAGIPASPALWRARSRGFVYTDPLKAERGAARISVKSDASMRSSFDVRANGARLAPEVFPLATPVTAQLVNFANGTCWESRFDSGDVRATNGNEFKAR